MSKLFQQLEAEAAKFGITVTVGDGDVTLDAPDHHCFEPNLHALVNGQWDNDPMPNVYRAAIRDVKENGPRLRACEMDCECRG